HALGLARMIMMAGLPIRLRVLIPAVDNAVSGNALRPLDVITTRKGLTVEVGNTDAEGRLILADTLVEADREKPELLIDFATLTGAARAALGPEVAVLFSNNDALAASLTAAGDATGDPLWRLPLWQSYRKGLESKVADLSSVASHGHAGAIIAALFLESFVSRETPWAHLDIMGWNTSSRPGRPEGGEAQGMRAAFDLIERRFSSGRLV
ncbi:MAG: leucyl aminopeptidase family protein, partial [Rhodospirillaceae bacterium]